MLEAVDARIRVAAMRTPFVVGITYDAKGCCERIDYGNGTFTEYEYDPLSFRLKVTHTAQGSAAGSWTRRYRYGDGPFTGSSPPDPPVPENNRLHSTSMPGDAPGGPYTAIYPHDANGNMVAMPHLAEIAHTHADQMKRADLGGGGTAYYT